MSEPARPIEFLREIIPNADLVQLMDIRYKVSDDKVSYTASDYTEIQAIFGRRLAELTD